MYPNSTQPRAFTACFGLPVYSRANSKKIIFQSLLFWVLLSCLFIQAATAQTNLAQGKAVTSSSVFDAALYPNTNLTDGSFSTFAHTGNTAAATNGEWLQVDLGADYYIDKVRIGCRNNNPNRLRRFIIVTWPEAMGSSLGANPTAYQSDARYNRLIYTDATNVSQSNLFGTTSTNPNLPGTAGQTLGPVFPSNMIELNLGVHKARYVMLLNLQHDYLDPTELQVSAAAPPVRAFTNGGFETGSSTSGFEFVREAGVPGWSTTEAIAMHSGDNTIPANGSVIELWRSGFNGVASFEGNYFAELNAFTNGMLVQQPICVLPGESFNFSFAHRGRSGVDKMRLNIDDVDVAEFSDNNAQTGAHSFSVLTPATTTNVTQAATTSAGWTQYSGTWTNTSGVSKIVSFGYRAISTAGGDLSVGNFLDAVTLTSLSTTISFSQATASGPETVATANLPRLFVTGNLAAAATVQIAITGGTATRGFDYTTNPVFGNITISIPAGFYDGTAATAISLAPYIQIRADLTPGEPNETINMALQNPSSAALQIADATSCGPGISTHVYTISDIPITVSGNVFNDVNGLTDNTVNGNGTNAGGLNAVLINNNTVIAVTTVNPAGKFNFSNIAPDQPYTIRITTAAATVGAIPPQSVLPSGWVSTGENNATTAGSDGLVNGTSAVFTPSDNTTNINFGIQQPPTANNDQSLGNPLGRPVTINVLTNDTDPAGGVLDPTTVSLVPPANATNIVTDTRGDIIGFTIPGQGAWTVNPTTGAVTFTPQAGFTGNPTPIYYSVNDNAGSPSSPALITIIYANAIPLPVKLTSFTARLSGNNVIVDWSTSQELSSHHFDIEFSTDAIRFTKIGQETAAGTSYTPLSYTYNHADAARNTVPVLYYRLKQVDIDGAFVYTNVVAVSLRETGEQLQVYPNPVARGANMTVRMKGIETITLYTLQGQPIWTNRYSKQPVVVVPATALPAGTYLLQVNGKESTKIIVR